MAVSFCQKLMAESSAGLSMKSLPGMQQKMWAEAIDARNRFAFAREGW